MSTAVKENPVYVNANMQEVSNHSQIPVPGDPGSPEWKKKKVGSRYSLSRNSVGELRRTLLSSARRTSYFSYSTFRLDRHQ